ncbi:MAG TPA: hypothetical protein VG222_02075 [Vicinamibacterales bacterium]|nr:hypothetical protein [Vicinamibacterales bacterium]
MNAIIVPFPRCEPDVAPDWADDLCAALRQLACARPAVARLIGDWIREALERNGGV